MKLKAAKKKKVDIGFSVSLRLKKKFLLFPMQIEEDRRWLETVYVVEKYHCDYVNHDDWEHRKWNVCEEFGFITPEEYPDIINDEKLMRALKQQERRS